MNPLQQFFTTPNSVTDQANTHPIPLHHAVEQGDLSAVTALLDRGGVNINEEDDRGFTALYKATSNNHVDIVELLLDRGGQPNKKAKTTAQQASPLSKAIQDNNFKLVKLFLDKGGDCHLTLFTGKSMLHIAAERGYLEIVQLLLDRGANPNVKSYSRTPLYLAKFSRYNVDHATRQAVVRTLLDRGADIRDLPLRVSMSRHATHNQTITSQEYMLYIRHGWNRTVDGIDAFDMVTDEHQRTEVITGEENLFMVLSNTLEQLNIQVTTEQLPEVLRFLSRVPYWYYRLESLKTFQEYYDDIRHFSCLGAIRYDISYIYYYFKRTFSPEVIDLMMTPLFEWIERIVELISSFKLTSETIEQLYNELNQPNSLIHQFLEIRLKHNWLEGRRYPDSSETFSNRPSP